MAETIKAKFILGEIYLSINTIKDILYKDLFIELEGTTKEEYIKNLIERFNRVKIEQ